MTMCCFIFILGILENQDSEFLAWVLVSTLGIIWGWGGRWEREETGSDGRIGWDPVSGEKGLPDQHCPISLLSLSRPTEPSPSLGPRSYCVHDALWGLSSRKKSDIRTYL